jgi:flagellin
MALSINTNTGALNAAAAASSVNKAMEISMERLATGKRINAAADDAAGAAIVSRLNSEIRGTNQSIRNAMDAQALIDTAEGASVEIENILQRMRELAVQSATGTVNSSDRTNLNTEYSQLVNEVNRIAGVTKWAGNTLLASASSTTFTFQIGHATGSTDRVTVSIAGLGALYIGSTTSVGSTTIAGSAGAARTAIDVIDAAITDVNTVRAKLGAYSNRMDHTVNNLTNITTNLQSGVGRIEDADFAAESSDLAKTQILQQASTAMLAQANASKQSVLSLLQS